MQKIKIQRVFSLIKDNADSIFKDSLINIMYLRKAGYSVGELAEITIVNNINRLKIENISAKHIGPKIKNKYDPKTDIVIKCGRIHIPLSVKTGSQNSLKIKNGILHDTESIIVRNNIADIKIALGRELSSNLYIFYIHKKLENFVMDLVKIDVSNVHHIKETKSTVMLKNVKNKTVISLDKPRLIWYANKRYVETIDTFILGKDNSIDKMAKGENLLINNIITNICLCNIPMLRKIDKMIQKRITN